MKHVIQEGLFIKNSKFKNNLKKILLSALCVSFLFLLHTSKLTSAPANATETTKLSHEKIKYIINKYEHTKIGTGAGTPCKAHLFYPAKNPKRLVIFFTHAFAAGRYNFISWFWNNDENWQDTAYLFVKDDQDCWYLGNDKQDFVPEYSAIIKHYINVCKLQNNKFTNDNVFTIGTSMGGYAAIFYATKLGLNAAIAINPQADKESVRLTKQEKKKNPNKEWYFPINNAGSRWQDLNTVIEKTPKTPRVILIYGRFHQDVAAGDCLINALKERSPMLLVRRHDSQKHAIVGLIFSKEFIEESINFIENQKSFAQDS